MKEGKVKLCGSAYGMYTIKINNTKISNFWILDMGHGFHICYDMQGLKESKEVAHGKLNSWGIDFIRPLLGS